MMHPNTRYRAIDQASYFDKAFLDTNLFLAHKPFYKHVHRAAILQKIRSGANFTMTKDVVQELIPGCLQKESYETFIHSLCAEYAHNTNDLHTGRKKVIHEFHQRGLIKEFPPELLELEMVSQSIEYFEKKEGVNPTDSKLVFQAYYWQKNNPNKNAVIVSADHHVKLVYNRIRTQAPQLQMPELIHIRGRTITNENLTLAERLERKAQRLERKVA